MAVASLIPIDRAEYMRAGGGRRELEYLQHLRRTWLRVGEVGGGVGWWGGVAVDCG